MGKCRAVPARWQNALWDIGARFPVFQLRARSRLAAPCDAVEQAERGRFVLWLPVFMGIGVLIYFALRTEPPAWLGAKFAAAGFAAALAAGARRRIARAAALALALTALGFASAQFAAYRAPPIETGLPSHAALVDGVVDAVEALPTGRRITLSEVRFTSGEQPEPRALTRTARLRLKAGDDTAVAPGDRVRVRAILRIPPPPVLPGGWDLQREAFFAGLGASGYALDRLGIEARAPPGSWAGRVHALRETVAARVSAAVPGPEGAIAVTLLTGESRGIPEADHDSFRASGLAHLLAVAGLHIGIVMGFALVLARAALALSERASLFWPAKQIAAVAALAVGGFYMVLTGAHVPIERSFAMACLFTLAVLAGRAPVSLRGLGAAAMALMAIAPWEVPGVSFQMSFSAVLALIAGYQALRPWLRRMRGKSRARHLLAWVAALALTSTLAGTASLPFAAYHFGHVQTWYILSNMAAVPVTGFWVMPAGLFGLALMPLGLERLALAPMGWGISLLIAIARGTAALPAATLAVPHIPAWGLGVLSLGIAWLGLWRSWARLLGLAAIAAGLASPLFDRPPDILVAPDASLIGFRAPSGVFLQRARGEEAFVRDAFLEFWGVAAAAPVPAEGWTDGAALTCVKDACVFRPRPEVMAALLVRGPSKPTGCGGAAVVVSSEPARGVCKYPAPRPVDRFTVWRDGAVAIWLEPLGARVLTDREARGDRPWVPPRPKPRPVPPPAPGLPLAAAG